MVNYFKEEKGVAIVTVMMFMFIMLALGSTMLHMTTANMKTSGALKNEIIRFYSADAGIFAISGWMTLYRRTDVPGEVLQTDYYTATASIMGDTVRDIPGYSVQWKGMDVLINSQSPVVNPSSEIEATVFIPVAPVGYGNE